MISDNDLKPCPFCNGKARFVKGGEIYSICCIDCHIETDCDNSPDSLAFDWNRRPHMDHLRNAIVQVLGELDPFDHKVAIAKLEAVIS